MKELRFHHSALVRGYIRIGETKEVPYKGRFGVGKKDLQEQPSQQPLLYR